MMPTLRPLTEGLRIPSREKILTPCGVCRVEVLTYPGLEATCPSEACRAVRKRQTRSREVARHLAELDEKLPRILKSRGMRPCELETSREGVTSRIWSLCEGPISNLLHQLETPQDGFGLIGKSGTGKTGLVAVVVKLWARKAAEAFIREWGVNIPDRWAPLWANWEGKLSQLRDRLPDRCVFAALMEELKEAPLLVLDDLGAERATEDSWGDERLYELLEARSSAGRAILWTSNLSKAALMTRYPSRAVSRLIGLAPALEVSVDMGDRRFAQARTKLGR